MHPILFKLGPIIVYSYGFFLAVAYLAATFIFWREGKKRGFKEEKLIDLSVLALLAAIVGGRLFYIFQNWDFFGHNFSRVFAVWEGGFSYYGALAAVFLVGAYLVRVWRWDFFQVADFSALAALAAIFFGKIGSFLSGNDYGSLTTLPWGVSSDFLEGSRHPVQIYEAIFVLVLFVILYRLYHKNLTRLGQLRSGSIFFYFLLFTSVGRLILEEFRGDSKYLGPFRVASLFAFALVIISVFGLYYYQFRNFAADKRAIGRYLLGFRNPFKK